jgi:hypothetical protein
MKPPLPRTLSAVPRTLHVQLEIAKAIRALAGRDEDDELRRQAEIAAIRRDCKVLKRDIEKAGDAWLTLLKAELRSALKKYSPDQPRVPAGNRDGGQWTGGSKAGSEAPGAPVRYASLENPPTGTHTDAMGSSGNTVAVDAHDTQNVVRNLYDVLSTIVRSAIGPKINVIGVDEVPPGHPREPVEFVDSSGRPILDDQGNPLLRPISLPPERYIQAGLETHNLAEFLDVYRQAVAQGGPGAEASPLAQVVSDLAVLPIAPGGPLDAERFDWQYVRDYRHYQNIMIGVYGAAAGLSRDDVLSLVDFYAGLFSSFRAPELKDQIYPHSARQDVEDTILGYRLYESGRIRIRNE